MGTGKKGIDAFADKVSRILPATTATTFRTHLELPVSLAGSNCSNNVLAGFNDWSELAVVMWVKFSNKVDKE
jgi:hypothetical protein